jgi:PAS domain S-box-containing protein
MRQSLKNKLAASHLAAIFITAAFLGIGSYILLLQYNLKATYTQLATTSEHAAIFLESFLANKKGQLAKIAESRDAHEFGTTYRELAMASYLRQFASDFSSISYISPDGREELHMVGQALSSDLRDFSHNSIFENALANPNRICYQDDSILPPRRVLTLALAKTARFSNEINFVLVAEVPLTAVEKLLNRFLRESEFMIVQDSLGRVLLNPRDDFLGKTSIRIFVGHGFSEENGLGVDGYYAAAALPHLRWTLTTGLPEAVYDVYPKQLRFRAFLAFLLTSLIGSFIANLASKKLTAPLLSLTISTQRIAEGKSAEPLPISSDDEVGTLIQSFNAMAAVLQKTTVSRDYVDNIIKSLRECLLVVGTEGNITSVNTTTSKLLGYKEEQLVGRSISTILPEEFPVHKLTDPSIELQEQEVNLSARSGDRIPVLFSRSLLRDKDNTFLGAICLAQDLRQRKKDEEEKSSLQAQLQQAQRLETVGTLAGGIAHDFNNILTAIIGFSQLARRMVPEDHPARQALESSLAAGFRAKDLVKQLLSFSRQGSQERTPLQVTFILKETVKLLRATIPTTIDIQQKIEPDSWHILADPSQLHQLIMNLCANASQAMENGGTLAISLANAELTSSDIEVSGELPPGRYVRILISDTGEGIDPAIMHRIFDPFFTTKDIDKGSGLGLAVVHGIVKAHGGDILVSSQLGKGTTFTIFLPACEEEEEVDQENIQPQTAQGGGERILVIDDEEPLAHLARKSLTNFGYQVVATSSSEEALDIFRASPDIFDLVVTDYAMPKMNGRQLSAEIRSLRKEIPIILSTGYNQEISNQEEKQIGFSRILLKPYTQEELARQIQEVLKDRSSGSPP